MTDRVITVGPSVGRNYLGEMSAAEIVGHSCAVFGRHFSLAFAVVVLPLVIVVVVKQLLEEAALAVTFDHTAIILVSLGGEVLLGLTALVVGGAMTVAVGDICLGNRPSFARSYGAIGGCVWKFIWTSFISAILIGIGMALLVIPGIIVYVLLIFVSPVCILERKFGRTALRRSAALTKGYRLRIVGILLIMYAPFLALGMLLAPFMPSETVFGISVSGLFLKALPYMFSPLVLIAIILMYHDLRARKENYDATRLAQDLTG